MQACPGEGGKVCLPSPQGAQMMQCSRRRGGTDERVVQFRCPQQEYLRLHWSQSPQLFDIRDTLIFHIRFTSATSPVLLGFYSLPVTVFLIFLSTSPSFTLFLFSSFQNHDRSQILPHLSHTREMAFCLFARRKTETLPELCKSFANCKTNQQRFTFSLLRREYFKRDCQAKKSNIGKHIL